MANYNRRQIRLLISFVLGAPAYLIFSLIRNYPINGITWYAFVEYGLTATLAFFAIFELQQVKSTYLNHIVPWSTDAGKRLVIELASSFVITVAVVIGCYAALYMLVWDMGLFAPSIFLYVSLVYFVSICFLAFVNAAPIIQGWKSSILKAEFTPAEFM